MWWVCESEKMHGIGGVRVRLFLFFFVCVCERERERERESVGERVCVWLNERLFIERVDVFLS